MPRHIDGLRLVALYKFGKALLLVATAYGVHAMLDPQLGARLMHWSATLTDHTERDLVERALRWFDGLGVSVVQSVVLVTGAYATLVMIEGLGLWWHRRWAEWLAAISGGALIPFELWRLVMRPQHNSVLVAGVLLANVLIVAYLIKELFKPRRPA